MTIRIQINKLRAEMGLAPLPELAHDVPKLDPLPKQPQGLTLDVPDLMDAWQAWLQTMYLSDGDRDAADVAFDTVRKQQRKEL
jgi:hypothetical protein